MWLVIGYFLIGIIRVGYDFIQPPLNQPRYIADRQWFRILTWIIFWPILLWVSMDIHYFFRFIKRLFEK